jgi:group II intron reverse transcriptase/maturase
MRDAETILGIIHDRGQRGLPLEDVYRQLFNPALYLKAYAKIYRNRGATTAGATDETVDGMSLEKIQRIIDAVRHERYRWSPVKRVYIEKRHSTKKRPLGLPTWSDKLLQEVIRLLLEAYYEPQFSAHSHGFRPQRGCHTALTEIQRTWQGTVWFIEGDISRCFDTLDHEVLLSILAEKIHDNRFLRLIRNLLQAGYLEEWRHHATLSGTPQGGIVSPILANIYLDRLDQFVTTTLLPAAHRGKTRKNHPAYNRLCQRAWQADRRGRQTEAAALRKEMQTLPSGDPNDPDYRRLRYVRYADDFLLGFIGPKHEAEAIRQQISAFLGQELKLELSPDKTLITHARTQAARFLGYAVQTLHNDQYRRGHRRSVNGAIGLKVPPEVIREKAKRYLIHGRPLARSVILPNSIFSIVAEYQQAYRGIVEYYRLATNLHRFSQLKWIMDRSLHHTLARKLNSPTREVRRRYKTTLETEQGPQVGLKVTVERGEGQKPLVAVWGGVSLKRRLQATLNDQPYRIWNQRTELLERLLASECELCGATEQVEVHHLRALKELRKKGRAEKPTWMRLMATRRRKTLVVCHACHAAIHGGRYDGHRLGQ